MREELLQLQRDSQILEPNAKERKEIRDQIIDYTESFLEKINTTHAYRKSEGASAEISDINPTETTLTIEEIISKLADPLDEEGINPASGGHLGYIPGGGIYASSLADYWAAISNRYAGVFFANPGAVRLENKLIQWLSSVIGYPASAHGNLTSGGSIANMIGIVTGRHSKGIKAIDIPTSCIYLTKQAHHSIAKSIQVAALHECQIRYIDLDEGYRMNVSALENAIKKDLSAGLRPFLIVGSAGTTDVGAIDPMNQMADVAEKYNCWFHVDAAYGGFFILTDEIKPKYKGIERADSVVIDPHKGLFLPYGLGVCLVKNRENLQKAFTFQASYLQDIASATDEINPMDVSPEMTKHFRGLRLWIPIMLYGIEPFKAALQEKLLLTRYFQREIEKIQGFKVGLPPELSVITFRYIPDSGDENAFNKAIMEYVHRDGRVFFSSTTIDGKFTLRLAILSFRSHLSTIDLALTVLKEAVAHIKSTSN